MGANWLLDHGWRFLFEDATSILLKSMYCGFAIVTSVLLVSPFLKIFLSWVTELMTGMSLLVCLLVVFLVVLLLFLIPPITGQVIYGFATIVIIPKFGVDDIGKFWSGVAVSSLVCLVSKLVAAALEQKAIGVPFASSVAVKKFVGVHSEFMKAMRCILSEPRLSVGKICILSFGPDFPTSVLTGILDLPLVPMLLGTLPVVVVILPTCISFAFLFAAEERSEHQSQNKAIAGINLLLSAIVSSVGNGFIAYFVQTTLAAHEAELSVEDSDWMRDPLEAEVLESIERDRHEGEHWSTMTSWRLAPRWIRVCLIVGSFLSTTVVYVLCQPFSEPFEKFSLGDEISELPGGSIWGAVHPLGWMVVGLSGCVLGCIAAFKHWARAKAQGATEK